MSDITAANPWRDPKVVGSILERREQQYIDNLRKAAQKIIDHYSTDDLGVSKEAMFAHMATLGDIEQIALVQTEGEIYLQKLRDFCHQEVMRTMPPTESKTTTVDTSKPHLVGTGANRHIDTGVVKVPQANPANKQRQEPLEAPTEAKQPTTVLGNPIPTEPQTVEIPEDVKAAMEAMKHKLRKLKT